MATPSVSIRQATTAETLRQNQERIEELKTLIHKLWEAIRNGLWVLTSERGESPLTSAFSSEVPDILDTKVLLPDLFTGNSAEYRSFIAQCSLVFAACLREYIKDEREILFVISRLGGPPFSWVQSIALDLEQHRSGGILHVLTESSLLGVVPAGMIGKPQYTLPLRGWYVVPAHSRDKHSGPWHIWWIMKPFVLKPEQDIAPSVEQMPTFWPFVIGIAATAAVNALENEFHCQFHEYRLPSSL